MVKIKYAFSCFLALLMIGTSQVHAAAFEGHHLATAIDVDYRQEHQQISRRYQQNEHMEEILNYLRLLEYAGVPKEDPELVQGDTYRITVHLADGHQHIYHLHADRYLSRDFRPWIKVESSRSLQSLLNTLGHKI